MKQQIRSSVFETNSSSVHTISIMSKLPEGIIFPDKVVFGKGPDAFSDYMENTIKQNHPEYYKENVYTSKIQEKLDCVMGCILRQPAGDYLSTKRKITEALAKIGVSCEFVEDVDHLRKYEFIDDWCSDSPNYLILGLIDDRVGDKEVPDALVNYLFGDDSFYDSYDTDGCSPDYNGPETPDGNITYQEM